MTHTIQRKTINGLQAYLIVRRDSTLESYYYHLAYKDRPINVCSLLNRQEKKEWRESDYISCKEKIEFLIGDGKCWQVVKRLEPLKRNRIVKSLST